MFGSWFCGGICRTEKWKGKVKKIAFISLTFLLSLSFPSTNCYTNLGSKHNLSFPLILLIGIFMEQAHLFFDSSLRWGGCRNCASVINRLPAIFQFIFSIRNCQLLPSSPAIHTSVINFEREDLLEWLSLLGWVDLKRTDLKVVGRSTIEGRQFWSEW